MTGNCIDKINGTVICTLVSLPVLASGRIRGTSGDDSRCYYVGYVPVSDLHFSLHFAARILIGK